MSGKRRWLAIGAGLYAAVGAVLATQAGDSAMGRHWVERRLLEYEELEPLELVALTALEVRLDERDRFHAELTARDATQADHAFEVEWPLGVGPGREWEAILASFGPADFAVGGAALPVAADGRVSPEAVPITAESYDVALFASLEPSARGGWQIRLTAPPPGGRGEQRFDRHAGVLLHLPQPWTERAERKRDRMALALRPAAFVFDAATWPAQVLVLAWAVRNLRAH